MNTDGLSYYVLTDKQRSDKLQPGTLWKAKDSWNFSDYKCKKDEIVMIVSSELFYDVRWPEAHDREKLRTHIKFMGNNIATMSIPVQNWFVWFREMT